MPLTLHLQPHTVIVITTPQGDLCTEDVESHPWQILTETGEYGQAIITTWRWCQHCGATLCAGRIRRPAKSLPQGDIRISRDAEQGYALHIDAPREFGIRREKEEQPSAPTSP